jgi:hypothetical protein
VIIHVHCTNPKTHCKCSTTSTRQAITVGARKAKRQRISPTVLLVSLSSPMYQLLHCSLYYHPSIALAVYSKKQQTTLSELQVDLALFGYQLEASPKKETQLSYSYSRSRSYLRSSTYSDPISSYSLSDCQRPIPRSSDCLCLAPWPFAASASFRALDLIASARGRLRIHAIGLFWFILV